MKIVKILLSIIIVAVVGVYVVAFTPVGNSILKPIIETKAKEASNIDIELEKFSLSFGSLDILVHITPSNSLHVKGDFNLFSQSFDINYKVNFLALKELNDIAKQKLNGEFKTNGRVKGDMEFLTIKGKSNVAKSNTSYQVELTKLNPTSIIAHIKDLKLSYLLYMVGQKQYASSNVNLDINFKNITPHNLDGDIKLLTKNGKFNTKVLREDFKINIPKTSFNMNLDALLKGDDINYNYIFNSNLAKLTSNGKVIPNPLKLDISYKANIKELALLKPITGADLRGKVNFDGKVRGDKEKLQAILHSNIASSNTKINVELKEFKPSFILADIKHLKLQKLLYMVKQPHYTDGDFNLKAKLTSLEKDNLKGNILTSVNGKLDTKYLTKAYKFKHQMPKTLYNLKAYTTLDKTYVDTKLNLKSTLMNLDVKKARFDLKDSSLKSDYIVDIASLEKLYFVTDRHLRGGIKANGNIKKDKDLLFLANSKIANGDLHVKLLNDDLSLNLKDMRTKKVLWILKYPEFFDGGVNADVIYNLANSKGDVKAKFVKGIFVKNEAFDLLKQYGHINLYKERYDGDAKANINKEKIFATFNLKSKKSSITSDKTKLNTKKSTIDSAITITAKKTPVTVTLKGKISSPKVGIDLKKFMQSEAGKKLEKKATKELDKLFKKFF